ncbi:hypothetical protein O9929_11700 [Vibrio lentus]|nr:hypothetical protein [Vibrio lentus]
MVVCDFIDNEIVVLDVFMLFCSTTMALLQNQHPVNRCSILANFMAGDDHRAFTVAEPLRGGGDKSIAVEQIYRPSVGSSGSTRQCPVAMMIAGELYLHPFRSCLIVEDGNVGATWHYFCFLLVEAG